MADLDTRMSGISQLQRFMFAESGSRAPGDVVLLKLGLGTLSQHDRELQSQLNP